MKMYGMLSVLMKLYSNITVLNFFMNIHAKDPGESQVNDVKSQRLISLKVPLKNEYCDTVLFEAIPVPV